MYSSSSISSSRSKKKANNLEGSPLKKEKRCEESMPFPYPSSLVRSPSGDSSHCLSNSLRNSSKDIAQRSKSRRRCEEGMASSFSLPAGFPTRVMEDSSPLSTWKVEPRIDSVSTLQSATGKKRMRSSSSLSSAGFLSGDPFTSTPRQHSATPQKSRTRAMSRSASVASASTPMHSSRLRMTENPDNLNSIGSVVFERKQANVKNSHRSYVNRLIDIGGLDCKVAFIRMRGGRYAALGHGLKIGSSIHGHHWILEVGVVSQLKVLYRCTLALENEDGDWIEGTAPSSPWMNSCANALERAMIANGIATNKTGDANMRFGIFGDPIQQIGHILFIREWSSFVQSSEGREHLGVNEMKPGGSPSIFNLDKELIAHVVAQELEELE